jgi:hypothetical protein
VLGTLTLRYPISCTRFAPIFLAELVGSLEGPEAS